VHATNANGSSVESSASSAVTPALPPGAPTNASASAAPGQATVSFTAPASDGGSPITGYTVTSSPGGLTGTCSASPCTVTGLTDGTSYTFSVHATNAVGSSAESAPSAAVTPVSAPGAPTAVTAAPGDTQATVSFTAPASDGGSPITSYTVTSTPGGLTATCPSSPCIVTGLTNGTSYTFTVHATNAVGDSAQSVPSPSVSPAALPGAPTNVGATAGDGQASVSFTAPASDGGSAITSYTVTSSPGGLTATCASSPCVVTGLTNGTAYTFTAQATNAIGASAASSASPAVTPLGAPSAPSVTATVGDGQVTVSFAAPGNGGSSITGYQVSTDGGATWSTLSTTETGGTVTGTVTGLTNGTTYSVQVRAVNAQGVGSASPPESVTPATVPDSPTGVSATRGDNSATVTFTAPSSTGGSAILAYTVTADPGGLTASCPSSPCTISGLVNGTSYTFTVHATNTQGDSAESNASGAVTPATVPGAPGPVAATAGNGSADLTFSAPSTSGGSPVTGYEYSTDGGASWSSLATSGTATVTATVTGLTNGTAYSIAVRAVNAVGNGPASVAGTVTPGVAPSAATGLTAVSGNGSATLSFTPGDDGGSAVTGYEVSTDGGATWATLATAAGAGGTRTGTVTGLTNGTTYSVTVRAVNVHGFSPASSGASVTPAAVVPAAPSGLTATPGNGSAAVAFTPGNDGGSAVTGYEVSTDGGATWATLATAVGAGGTRTGTVTGLTNGTTYSIAVRTVNGVGNSPASDTASVSRRQWSRLRPVASLRRLETAAWH